MVGTCCSAVPCGDSLLGTVMSGEPCHVLDSACPTCVEYGDRPYAEAVGHFETYL